MGAFNMPPGVSPRDIPGNNEPDPSDEELRVAEILDTIDDLDEIFNEGEREKLLEIVGDLATERDDLKRLLQSALPLLPEDSKRVCTCNVWGSICPVHEGTDPTLREEIEAALKPKEKKSHAITHD